jgi:hypothetical protein
MIFKSSPIPPFHFSAWPKGDVFLAQLERLVASAWQWVVPFDFRFIRREGREGMGEMSHFFVFPRRFDLLLIALDYLETLFFLFKNYQRDIRSD